MVSSLGSGTPRLSLGQRVFGITDWHRDGTLAEYAAVEARNLAPLPGNVDFTVGASLRMVAVSAVAPGKVQHRTGTPSRVTAIAITTCGRSARWSSECPNARAPASVGLLTSSSPGSSASSASSSAVSVAQ